MLGPEEANKIIAEFMSDVPSAYTEIVYSNSLDALVPVWGKMIALPEFENRVNSEGEICRWSCRVNIQYKETYFYDAKTIQEAAAIATAKAVKNI